MYALIVRSFVLKKFILIFICGLLCLGLIATTYMLSDRKAPQITLSGTPSLGCSSDIDSLLSYASATDNKKVSDLFIEERDILSIADKGHLTYVAIDDSNNVARKTVNANIDPQVIAYYLDVPEEIKIQLEEPFEISEYASVKNGCGWTIDKNILADKVNTKNKGAYEIGVTSVKYSNIEEVKTIVNVGDFESPVIILKESELRDTNDGSFSDNYFLRNVDHVEDADDDLAEKVECDWREVTEATGGGFISKTGTFTITYSVTDSDGNTGEETAKFVLEEPAIVETVTEGE